MIEPERGECECELELAAEIARFWARFRANPGASPGRSPRRRDHTGGVDRFVLIPSEERLRQDQESRRRQLALLARRMGRAGDPAGGRWPRTGGGGVYGASELPGSERGVTVADALRYLKADPDNRLRKLRDCLMEWCRNDDLPSALTIGQRLKAIRGRVCTGRYVQSTKYQGTHVWKVVNSWDPGHPSPRSGRTVRPRRGIGGIGGIYSLPRAKKSADNCQR
jgi:hypothetical protein